MTLFTTLIKKILSSTLCVTLLATTMPMRATAGPVVTSCASATAADSGADPRCAATRIGGQVVPFVKLDWERMADMPVAAGPDGARSLQGTDEAVLLANRSAVALSKVSESPLQAKDVASMVTMFPANIPFIYARFNPLDNTLRVDAFKLERTVENGQARSGLYHAAFTPLHGDFWKASRAYIHPDAYRAGNTPGVNPFIRFHKAGSDSFEGISLTGAQVAVGHAMRYLGAPVSILQVAEPRLSQETRKSGNAFRKKVTTIINGHAKPIWMISHPGTMVDRSTAMPVAGFCAPDPDRDNCALYETASSGVSFEVFEGGMLDSFEDTWELDRKTKSGWGFLTILLVAVIGSFLLAAVAPALGLGAGAGAGASSGAAAGMFGNMLISQGFITGFSSLAASIAVETLYIAASMAIIGGANLSSMMVLGPAALLGFSKVDKGTAKMADKDEYAKRLGVQIENRTASDPGNPNRNASPMLTGFTKTVEGNCSAELPTDGCPSAGSTGVAPRVDQYREFQLEGFIRDNNGGLVHDGVSIGRPNN